MGIRTALVFLDGGGGSEAALETALTLIRDWSAHLEVLHVRPDPQTMVPVIGEGMSGVMVEQMMSALASAGDRRAEAAHKLYKTLCLDAGLSPHANPPGKGVEPVPSVAWREETGREDEIVSSAARLHDLIVMGRPDEEGGAGSVAALESALLDSGRPVLLAPSAALKGPARRFAIAWNGKAQAARAVAAALPLLAKAERVSVISLTEGGASTAPDGLVRYLGWHGITALVDSAPVGGAGPGAALLDAAARADADLLVMGAYGHSRLRELILGGATKGVLSGAAIPVLLAH